MSMADHRPTRTGSVSSNGTVTSANLSFVPRYTPHPEPAYISSAAASEHVTHRHRHENYDLLSPAASPTSDGAVFSDSALSLLNTFLDSLLYNFLAKARSTNLNQLRPAILEVLKPRLGREALASADEELQGLVGDGDSDTEDQFDANFGPSSAGTEWHLESAFKRMRLRVMVFIRLGDFDDEDEERYLEDDSEQPIDFSFQSSPAPVYLASVLEYLAEQTLSLAGDASYGRAISRTRRSLSANTQDESRDLDDVVVEDKDVEKIALNPALGRLWRTWLKSYRGINTTSPLRGYPRRSSFSSPTRASAHELSRNSGIFADSNSHTIKEERETPTQEYPDPHDNIPEGEPNETDIAANIPLPISDLDVDEIEVPGLAKVIYDEDDEFEDDDEWEEVQRPRGVSFIEPRSSLPVFSTEPEETASVSDIEKEVEPVVTRQRSNSVPSAAVMPWGWVPLHVRKTLEKVAKYNEELLSHATNVPLPLQENDVNSIGSRTPDLNDSQGFVTPSPSPAGERKEIDEKRVSSQSSRASLIAGATALVAGAAAMAATLRGSKNEHSRASLDVQTKEVFDPDDEADSKRASREQVAALKPTEKAIQEPIVTAPEIKPTSKQPIAIIEPKEVVDKNLILDKKAIFEKKSIVENKPIFEKKPTVEKKSIVEDKPVVAKKTLVEEKVVEEQVKPQDRIIKEKKLAGDKRVAEARRMFENKRLADEKDATETSRMARESSSKATSGVYKPKSATSSPYSSSDNSTLQTSFFPPRNDSKNLVDTAVRGGVYNPRRSPDLEKSKPTLEIPPVSAPIDSPIKSASSIATREAEEESPISPVEPEDLPAPQPQKKVSPTVTGPPKPSTTAANPYAMLYDDMEPELIGVAKTSNIPIHAATPTLPSEQRPWTPNRGASSVTISSSISEKPTSDKLSPTQPDKQKPLPSPVRTIAQDTDNSPIVTKTLVVNDGNPLNAERFQSWNRAKESPTLPRFFAQATTPTESEHRSGSLAQSINSNKNSPKGSQGSTGNVNKREEEAAREKKFEALLGNDGPVKYTLTPEEIRDSSPYAKPSERKVPAPIDTKSATKAPAGVKSPSLFRKSVPPPSPKRPLRIKDIREMIMAMSPEPIEPKVSPKSGLVARDARVYGGETKDFVDWIRTTGPTSEQQVQPIVLSHRLSQASSLNLLSANTPNPAAANRVTSPTPQKSNMIARDETVRGEANDDLLDFLRTGPPGSGPSAASSAPRVPVNKGVAKTSPFSKPPVASTFKSNAPLANTNKPLPSNGEPTRTRRRPKDIYAIDSDSDDENYLGISSSRNVGNSGNEMENLQDFLRSTSPPVSNGFASGRSGSAQALNGTNANGIGRSNSIPAGAASDALPNGSLSSRRSNPTLSTIGRIGGVKRQEARAAGATKNFNGRGYHYSTNDMADFLRTSGPDAMGAPRATAPIPFRAASPAVDRKDNKRGRAFWKRGVEAGA